jgi:hypothetical protein
VVVVQNVGMKLKSGLAFVFILCLVATGLGLWGLGGVGASIRKYVETSATINGINLALEMWIPPCLLRISAYNSGLLETRVSTIARTPHGV